MPHRPKAKPPSALKSVFWGFYKFLVVISAVIVAAYLGWNLLVTPPEQAPPPPITQPDRVVTDSSTDSPAPESEALVRRERVYNVLLAATDKEGLRTDTMMVLSYDIPNQRVGVVSIPRDTLIQRPKGKNPKLVYGAGGVEQRASDISALLGIPIDYYVKVDLNAFVALVDQVGGVDFYVPCDMSYDDPVQDLSIHFKKGQRHLSGQEAMEVARFRKNNDGSGYTDVGRTQTQQNLLVALAKKVLAWGSLTRINRYVELFDQYVDTDLDLKDMLYFASQAIQVDPATGVETCTLAGDGNAIYRGHTYCYALDQAATLDTVNRLLNPYTRDLTLADMTLLKATG